MSCFSVLAFCNRSGLLGIGEPTAEPSCWKQYDKRYLGELVSEESSLPLSLVTESARACIYYSS